MNTLLSNGVTDIIKQLTYMLHLQLLVFDQLFMAARKLTVLYNRQHACQLAT